MLKTEMRNPKSTHIDKMDTLDMVKLMNEENYVAVKAVEDASEQIAAAGEGGPVTSAKVGDTVLLLDLNLVATEVSDISGLTNLPSLQTLNLEHTKGKDLTPLSRMKEGTTEKELPLLTKVTVSKDMLPLEMDPDATYEVILVK